MATMYDDVYMRDSLSDQGMVPASGAWTKSPDIIPNGTVLIQDPVKTLTDSWNSDVGQPTTLNQQNYFYVRAKNLSDGAATATLKLYYCPQHLFLFPGLWVENLMATSDGKTEVSASAGKKGDILVPDRPFTNVPISQEHHCLIGQVITNAHPNPVPMNISDMGALAQYILSHPNMAWRNVVLVQKDIPTFTHYFNLDTGDEGGEVLMGVSCKNITVGSSVAFSCGTPIPSGQDKGKLIELVKTPVPQSDIFMGQEQYYLPANFKTKISYSYWAKPPIQEGWDVHFEAFYIVEPSHELYKYAATLSELGYPGARDGGIGKLIRIGQCSTSGR
jgi:hypothetical protein